MRHRYARLLTLALACAAWSFLFGLGGRGGARRAFAALTTAATTASTRDRSTARRPQP